MRKSLQCVLLVLVAALTACGPSKDDVLAACVEIGETRKMDGAVRIRILRELGVSAEELEHVHDIVELQFFGGGAAVCAEYLEEKLGLRRPAVPQQRAEPKQTLPQSVEAMLDDPIVLESISGMKMRVLRLGDGETVRTGQTVIVHYTGWLFDDSTADGRGAKFDSSVDRGQHFISTLGEGYTMEGWDRGVAGMKVGEVRELIIPPELAYGERGAGSVIPPDSTLVLEIELLGVEREESSQ